MTDYTGTFTFYNSFRQQIAESVNLSADTLIILLVDDSYVPDATNHTVLADISGEVAGNGYTRQTLSGVTFTLSGGSSRLDFDDAVFEAVGGSWSAKRFVIFDDSVSSPVKPLIGYGSLRSDGQEIEVTDGNTLTFQTSAGGLFSLG